MLICKFSGQLVNIEETFHFPILKYSITFDISSCVLFPLDKKKGKRIAVLRRGGLLLPFYCSNIEKRVASEELTSLPCSILREYLSLIVCPFTSEYFSALYKRARESYLLYEDWKGLVFFTGESENEKELYEIGVALLSLNENE